MTPILECLSRWPQQPPGLVVHLGAGDGAVLDDYASLKPQRLVLVEGDADVLADLRLNAQRRPWAEVRGEVVAARSGDAPWHRFNLRALNGPVELSGLETFYPRLQSVGRQRCPAVALAGLLADVLGEGGGPAPKFLVLDLPGQEAALLASLPDALLQRFDGVIVRSCSAHRRAQGAGEGVTADDELERRQFQRCDGSGEAEPLWPVTAWSFDVVAHRQRVLQDRLAYTERERDRALAEAGAQRAAQQELVQAQQRAIEQEAALRQQIGQLESSVAAQSQAQDAAAAEAQQQRSLLAELQAERERLSAQAAELGPLAERLAAAQSRAAEAATALQSQAAELAERDVALKAQAAQRSALEARAAEAEARANELAAALQARSDELHELTARLQSRETEAAEALQAIDALKAEHAAALAHASEQGELSAAEIAQLKSSHEVMAGERDQQARREHQDQAAADKCKASLEALQAERAADRKRAAEQVAQLERELAEARQTASLSTKLQMLRESDLRDLQGRYQAEQAKVQNQHDLLSKLAQRLGVATRYFEQLSLEQQGHDVVEDGGDGKR